MILAGGSFESGKTSETITMGIWVALQGFIKLEPEEGDGSPYAQNPALHTRGRAFGFGQLGSEERGQLAGAIGSSHPFRNRIGVVLIGVAIFARERPAIQRRIGLDQDGTSGGWRPAVEGPEVDLGA